MEKMYSIKDAAEQLGIKLPTLRKWVRNGRIGYCKVGHYVRFTQKQIDDAVHVHERPDAEGRS